VCSGMFTSQCLEKSSFWPGPTLRAPSISCMIEDSLIILDIDAMRKRGLVTLAFFYHDFREDQKKGSVLASFANSPTPTVISFLTSI